MGRLTVLWRQWAGKFAARSLRERAMIAAGAVAVVVMLFDSLALTPLAIQYKRLNSQVAEARAAIKAGEQAALAGRESIDPDEVKRRYRDELRKQIAEIDGKLQGLQKQLVPPDQVANLLEGVLARERGLALVSLRKLPVQQFQTGGKPAGKAGDAKAEGKGAAGAERSIYQHSFEIEIEGSYAELHGYLSHLEKLPWQLFWGKAVLDADKHPRLKLTLTVHTLSMNKVWLIV
jgi:MSHA biogenesis protein MshJ